MSILTPDETLLGLLAASVQHGYQLLDCFRDPAQLGRVWALSTSQLYAVLKRLNREGLITGTQVQASDAPTRTEYALTDIGWQRLNLWLHEPQPSASIRSVRVEFLSRLYVARLLNVPTLPMIAAQKEVCRQKRATLVEQRECASLGVELLTVEFEMAQLDAVLQWIDRCELSPHDADLEETETR
jgi:PadR family transcriptional regulator, regulatory protein AphA